MRKKNLSPLEGWEQEQIFRWAKSMQLDIPELQLLNASMNGVRLSPSLRLKMQRQGLRSGFPDIDLPISRHGYHGLKVELKREHGGTVSPDQKRIIEMLKKQNYYVAVARGHKNAIKIIEWYLKGEHNGDEK